MTYSSFGETRSVVGRTELRRECSGVLGVGTDDRAGLLGGSEGGSSLHLDEDSSFLLGRQLVVRRDLNLEGEEVGSLLVVEYVLGRLLLRLGSLAEPPGLVVGILDRELALNKLIDAGQSLLPVGADPSSGDRAVSRALLRAWEGTDWSGTLSSSTLFGSRTTRLKRRAGT